jgi:DNA helicase-2/ATP-dependent DNA helicase PcrA
VRNLGEDKGSRSRTSHRDAVVNAAVRSGEGRPSAGGSSAPAGARGAERAGLRTGDDVVHEVFGEGIVIDMIGEGEHAEALIRFRDVGEKRLLLSWAPVRKVG